jgi:hypothetical protein
MARENRFERRVLAQQFNEFMRLAAAREVRARIATSPSGVVYVFLATDRNEPREQRAQELQLRCFVARGRQPEGTTVVGIATEQYLQGGGFSLDVARLTIETWTPEHEKMMRGIQADLGYFASPRQQRASVDEYPA